LTTLRRNLKSKLLYLYHIPHLLPSLDLYPLSLCQKERHTEAGHCCWHFANIFTPKTEENGGPGRKAAQLDNLSANSRGATEKGEEWISQRRRRVHKRGSGLSVACPRWRVTGLYLFAAISLRFLLPFYHFSPSKKLPSLPLSDFVNIIQA